MNAQTPGPINPQTDEPSGLCTQKGFTLWTEQGYVLAERRPNTCDTPPGDMEANAALLAAAYTAFDEAARELEVDAAELARVLPLAEVIRYALDYCQLHTAAHDKRDVGRLDQVEGARMTLARTAKLLNLG